MQSCPFLLSHLLSSAKSVTSKSHFTFFSLPIKSFDSTGVHIDATVSKAFACHIINLRFLNPRFSGLWTPSVSQVFVVPIKTVNTSSPSPQSIIIFRLKSARYRPLAPAQATVSAKLQTGCPSPRTQLLLFTFAANFSVRSKFASCTVLYMPVVITSILPHCTALIMASIPIIAMIHWTVRGLFHRWKIMRSIAFYWRHGYHAPSYFLLPCRPSVLPSVETDASFQVFFNGMINAGLEIVQVLLVTKASSDSLHQHGFKAKKVTNAPQ